jgi:hypothetical protein
VSKTTLFATLVGVVAGAIGVAGYRKASTLEDEIRRSKAAPVATTGDEALEAEVRRLESRVALLELRARTAPREGDGPGAPAAPAPAPAPEPPAAEPAHPHDDVGPAPKEPEKREERKQRVSATIDAFWKEWGAKNGLSPSQIQQLSAIQVEAAKRKLDNQAKMADHLITQPEARADNQAANDEVRRKAQALLSPAQLVQFEADKGAEWGSSYRKVRELHDKAAP